MRRKINCVILLLVILALSGCSEEELALPVEINVGSDLTIRTDISMKMAEFLAEKLKPALATYRDVIPFKSKRGRRFIITIFAEQQDFFRYQKKISPTKSKEGFYLPERGELVLLYREKEITLRSLYHEAFHAYLQERIIHPPAWLNEGLAEYVETLYTGFWGEVKVGKINTQTLKQRSPNFLVQHQYLFF